MKFILFIFTLYCTSLCVAQNVIKGKVKTEDNSPLQGCNVLLLQANEIMGGTVTDKKGNFELKDVPSGEYICKISMVGFKTVKHSFVLSKNVRLSHFVLREDTVLLSEVIVAGDKRDITQEKAGMTTYFLTERSKKTSDVFEALREVPRLVINTSTRSIKLDDGRIPLLLVNGIKRPIDSLDPELLESIDVIDNPSTRYMADESNQAILNVKVKRKGVKPYFNGNTYTKYMPNFLFGVSGLSTELGTEKFSLYANGQHWFFNNDDSETFSESYSENIHRSVNGNRRYNGSSYYLNTGGDYIFSSKNYAAFSFKFIGNPSENDTQAEGMIEDLPNSEKSTLFVKNLTSNKYKTLTSNLYYKHKFKSNRTLDFEGNYTYSFSSSEGERSDLSELYTYYSQINMDNNRHYGNLNINYSDLINGKYKLEIGSSANYTKTNIDDLTDKWKVYEHKKWKEYVYIGMDNNHATSRFYYAISIGMDMAFTNADGEKNKYIDILPSVSLSYQLTKYNTFSLHYNRNRYTPDASLMNPRNLSTDSLYISRGNPSLTPYYTDKIRFAYILNYKKLRFNPYVEYHHISDDITSFGEMDGNVYINTFRNMGNRCILQIGSAFNYNMSFGNLSASVWYQKDYIKNMPFNGNSWQANLNGYFFYKKVSLSLYLGYTNYIYSLTTQSKPIPFSNIEFTWSLPKNWQLTTSVEGLLCSELPSKVWVINGNYCSYSTELLKDRNPKFMIGISWSFKNKIQMKWRNKKMFYQTDSELEKIKVQ